MHSVVIQLPSVIVIIFQPNQVMLTVKLQLHKNMVLFYRSIKV